MNYNIIVDFEFIIGDDCSTDKSWEIIKSYSDTRIKAFRNKTNQRGLINSAINDVVNGEYIAIHHSDDVWEPNKLEKQVKILNKHPKIGAVFTHVKVINELGQPEQLPCNSTCTTPFLKDLSARCLALCDLLP